MTYTVLDLEWDSAYFAPEKRFINQILQIGAVKLDENFNIIDTFEQTIKSTISKTVSNRCSALTGITTEKMRSGIPINTAVEMYNKWITDDTITLTWSNSDLYTVVENEKALLGGLRFKIEKYLDLQSFIQNEMRLLGYEIKSQISLSDAADTLGIKLDGLDMHTAKDDSIVCAKLLEKFYNEQRFLPLIKDTSKNGFFDRISYKSEYVSDINDKDIDKNELEFLCDECGEKLTKKTKWHYKSHCFFAVMFCEKCNKKLTARVSFKKTFDGIITKKRLSPYKRKPKNKKPSAGENKVELQSLSSKM